MLVLSRKVGEEIVIADNIRVTVVSVSGNRVKLGFTAPGHTSSASGTASYAAAGRSIDWELTALFIAGGLAGMIGGTLVGRRIAGPTLQKTFAAAIVVVAVFVITMNLF